MQRPYQLSAGCMLWPNIKVVLSTGFYGLFMVSHINNNFGPTTRGLLTALARRKHQYVDTQPWTNLVVVVGCCWPLHQYNHCKHSTFNKLLFDKNWTMINHVAAKTMFHQLLPLSLLLIIRHDWASMSIMLNHLNHCDPVLTTSNYGCDENSTWYD